MYTLYGQVISFQNDSEQKFRTGFVLKNLFHEIIVYKSKTTDEFKVSFVFLLEFQILLFLVIMCHRILTFSSALINVWSFVKVMITRNPFCFKRLISDWYRVLSVCKSLAGRTTAFYRVRFPSWKQSMPQFFSQSTSSESPSGKPILLM